MTSPDAPYRALQWPSRTNATQRTTSDTDGHFSATGLSAGTYTVEVSASGFAISTRTGIRVAAGTADALSITLSVADVGQTVTVEAVASVAAQNAPSQSSLDTHSAKS